VAGENLIGEYLRARRELIQPADVGLPQPAGRRRVPGLRREEVAMLAGVSAHYYVRLEQGRDQHPSAQVLDALARALQLDDDAIAHLRSLAAPAARRRRRSSPRRERVPAGIVQSRHDARPKRSGVTIATTTPPSSTSARRRQLKWRATRLPPSAVSSSKARS
jgi:transcriptional regulator with XRE-family HTH domain